VWTTTRDLLIETLYLEECRYEPFGTEAPPLQRLGSNLGPRESVMRFLKGGFALPPEGAELVVEHEGDVLGRIVLLPGSDRPGVSLPRRRFAVTVAQLFAVAAAGAQGSSNDVTEGLGQR
jgi:hypothetical protein